MLLVTIYIKKKSKWTWIETELMDASETKLVAISNYFKMLIVTSMITTKSINQK